MYQSFLIIALIISNNAQAADKKNQIPKIFEEYSKKKDEFFKSEFTKKTIKEKLEEHLIFADAKYESIKKIETANNETLLSAEGNQLAYDIELLMPLKTLANSKFSSQDCSRSKHANLLNSDNKKETDKINLIIETICK